MLRRVGKCLKTVCRAPATAARYGGEEFAVILADATKKPTMIKGTLDLRADLSAKLESADARFFRWEQDRMYTKRESELIQQHLDQYGELPGGGDDELDDLF